MSVDQLPARTTTMAATDTGRGIATRTATVLNAAEVHRDRKQTAMYATSGAATLSGVAAALTLGLTANTALGYGLALLTALLVAAAMWLRFEVAAEGRLWVYATDPDTP